MVKSHASGMKHKNAVKKPQATYSVSHFFKVRSGVKDEMSKTLQSKEQSATMLCDAGGGKPNFTIPPTTSAKKPKQFTKGH